MFPFSHWTLVVTKGAMTWRATLSHLTRPSVRPGRARLAADDVKTSCRAPCPCHRGVYFSCTDRHTHRRRRRPRWSTLGDDWPYPHDACRTHVAWRPPTHACACARCGETVSGWYWGDLFRHFAKVRPKAATSYSVLRCRRRDASFGDVYRTSMWRYTYELMT